MMSDDYVIVNGRVVAPKEFKVKNPRVTDAGYARVRQEDYLESLDEYFGEAVEVEQEPHRMSDSELAVLMDLIHDEQLDPETYQTNLGKLGYKTDQHRNMVTPTNIKVGNRR